MPEEARRRALLTWSRPCLNNSGTLPSSLSPREGMRKRFRTSMAVANERFRLRTNMSGLMQRWEYTRIDLSSASAKRDEIEILTSAGNQGGTSRHNR